MPKDKSASAAEAAATAGEAPSSSPAPESGPEERTEAAAQRIASLMLLGAIETEDTGMFERALRKNADVNFGGGKPLELAAQKESRLFLRRLVTAGADISHALARLNAEQSAIPRKAQRRYDGYGYDYRTTYKYQSKEDQQRWKDLGNTVKKLKDYEKEYLKEALPVESLRLQHETLRELRELKDEILTAIHGRPLAKQKLPPPKPPAKNR